MALVAEPNTGVLSFRSVTVMATLIQRAIDGLPFLLASQPGFDIRMYASEVVTAIDLATGAPR